MIKKIFILFTSLLISLPTMANNNDYARFCPETPPQKFKISKITGLNWLSEKIAEGIIKKEIRKITKGKFKVSVKATGTLDLINGKFKSLTLNGKNLNVENIHISQFQSGTVCGFNSVKLNKDNIQFRENMVLNYQINIDNEALSQTLIDTGYLDKIRKYNLIINDIKTQIRNNKIYFIFEIPTFITKPIHLTISSKLNVKNGKIQLSELKSSNNTFVNTKKLLYILEKTNPIAFTSDIMNNKKSKIYVDSVNIINDTIEIKGLILIPKDIES